MGIQLGDSTTPPDPRGGFKHRPDFDIIRMVDGHVITDTDDQCIDRNAHDPYASHPSEDHDD